MAQDPDKKSKVEQNDPEGAILKSHQPDLACTTDHLISIYQPSVIIDCHMHIQSGNCAPLPLIWGKLGPLKALHLKRETIETVGNTTGIAMDYALLKPAVGHAKNSVVATIDGVGGLIGAESPEDTFDGMQMPGSAEQKELYNKNKLRRSIEQSKPNTYEIGTDFEKKKRQAAHNHFLSDAFYRGVSHLVFSCVVMTMDMEYAHIDGYFGLKVYNVIYKDGDESKKPTRYWFPMHGNWIRKERDGTVYFDRDDHPLGAKPLDEQTEAAFAENKQAIQDFGLPGFYYDDAGTRQNVSVMAAPCLAPASDTSRYEQWEKQLQYTELAILGHPLKLLPLFHYDPRRWQVLGNTQGNAHPFEQVGAGGLYLGFKIYTAQGYRPWEPRLPILKDFYAKCVQNHTPIMNHCTPDGAATFDREEYINFFHPLDTGQDIHQRRDISYDPLATPNRAYEAVEYFNRHFVSPQAWRMVLDQTVNGTSLNTLRLCLAHFGGHTTMGREWSEQIIALMLDYPNLYADLSSSFGNKGFRRFFKNNIYENPAFEKIRERILFGTDWYLTLLDGKDYLDYCIEIKSFLDNLDTSLWFRFTEVNPFEFYRLDEQIERIAKILF